MSTKTRAELIDQALRNLGVLVEGQSSTAEMVQKVDIVIDPHMAELRTEELLYVADYGTPAGASALAGGAIPLEFFLPLGDTLAWACAPSFSLAGDPSLKTLDSLAREKLEKLTTPKRTRRMLRLDSALRSPGRVASGNFSQGT